MIVARWPNTVRMFVLVTTTAAFVLCMSLVVAQTSAAAPTATKSTSTVSRRHARGDAAEAQNRRSEHFQKLTQRLKLTDDQATRVKSIMDARWAQSSELRAKYQGQPATPESKAAMKQARKELHADTDAKLAQILTADQMTEFKMMRAEHMKHRGSWKDGKDEGKEGKE